jgi:chromosome segregation ATPase
MMDAKTMQQLRPRDASATSIAASFARMQEALTELKGELTAHENARRGLLVSGTNAELDKHEARTRGLKLDIERIETTIEELGPDLAIARGRERLAHLEALRVEAETATERFREFWVGRYEALAHEIAAGLDLANRARTTLATFNHAAAQADADVDVQAAGGVPVSTMPPLPWAYAGATMKSPTLLICLPAVEPGQSPIAWPAGHALEQAKSGAAAAYA